MSCRLLCDDSVRSADLYYATGLFAPDPFLFFRDREGRSHVVISSLEIDRARRVARVDEVHDWSDLRTACRRHDPENTDPSETDLTLFFLQRQGVKQVTVPHAFPHGLARHLQEIGIEVLVEDGPFWPERAIKRDTEVTAITEALRITGQGMAAGIALIRAATIGEDGWLRRSDGQHLTSEDVRGEINATLVRAGARPEHTIVAGGDQGADPHEEGSGPLPAHRGIILDVFPRVERSGYWGDMTRTVCRGRAPERLKSAWEAVRQGQEVAFSRIRAGASGAQVHQAVTDHLTQAGFPTGPTTDGRQGGFFHGTGHGLGLEIHEAPRIGKRDQTLEAGHVVTVEPGLYYPDLGGVRLEDVVVVTRDGCRNLTDFPKVLEI
ncbi:MAG: aminopeptidase P family protein [Magnetococcales bacterium]|nr:aminopeptidase P family protein [Magnetococcales bacterium]